MNQDLIAPCGIYCRLCSHHFGTTPEGATLQEPGAPCKGCLHKDVSQLYKHCQICEMRPCAKAKGVMLCSQCPDFPCEKVKPFQSDSYPHHNEAYAQMMDFTGTKEQWVDLLEKRWSCPQCGAPFGYYENVCRTCGAALNGLPPRG